MLHSVARILAKSDNHFSAHEADSSYPNQSFRLNEPSAKDERRRDVGNLKELDDYQAEYGGTGDKEDNSATLSWFTLSALNKWQNLGCTSNNFYKTSFGTWSSGSLYPKPDLFRYSNCDSDMIESAYFTTPDSTFYWMKNRTPNSEALPKPLVSNEILAVSHSGLVPQSGSDSNSRSAKPFRLKTLLETGDQSMENRELQEICEFARYFKFRRLTMGLTQTQVCLSLNEKEGSVYSQSAICRFEKLDVTAKSARRMKPVLERWLADKELEASLYEGSDGKLRYLKFQSNSIRRRKRRTCFSPRALSCLTDQLRRNPYPTSMYMQ
ncbi:unnamed protein product [Echinostoma caproni]|uniref:POU-specific domain-containing protein n=1 Tax=Echinostoma caproni TaxID=27848 RepID=A0A183AI02_9TREM|nr:unnamed protein product [Echinostoma caproni]